MKLLMLLLLVVNKLVLVLRCFSHFTAAPADLCAWIWIYWPGRRC